MFSYDVRVFEKAESWFFYETVQADSQADAVRAVRKLYAKRKGFAVMAY